MIFSYGMQRKKVSGTSIPTPSVMPYAEATVERFKHYIGNVRGDRDFGIQELHPLGKHPDDVITHIQPIAPSAKARLRYPTQKPEELLEYIIQSTSKPGDTVLDPFCGCGTAIAVAQKLNRDWIGIDITHLAITLIKHRFGDDVRNTYSVIGEPVSVPDAETLAADDPYQFQWWALGLVGARPVEQKKGADRGIDGRLYFHDEAKGGKTKQIIFSVKAGHTGASHVRNLRGVLDREKPEIGGTNLNARTHTAHENRSGQCRFLRLAMGYSASANPVAYRSRTSGWKARGLPAI